jgi:hypothetical protein
MGFASSSRLLVVWLLLAILAGCSGSSGTSGSGDVTDPGEPLPPPEQTPPGDGDADTPPSVTFTSSDDAVPSGDSTTLTWSSQYADSCAASGGWSGNRPIQGSASVGPLNDATTFTLTCSGPGGSSVAMLSVSVEGVVSLAWQPPGENEDGSPLTDLSGYRIYYGSFSRSYNDTITVNDAAATQWEMQLSSGEYYIAMTAFDTAGNESAYSNEIVRSVN